MGHLEERNWVERTELGSHGALDTILGVGIRCYMIPITTLIMRY